MSDAATMEIARHFRIERVIAERGIKLRGKIERVGPCPICGGRDRFAINIKKQLWNCRGCCKGGDAIALVQFLDSCDYREAISILAGETPSRSAARPQRASERSSVDDYERLQRDKARRLLRASQAAAGTPVDFYIRRERGIIVPLPTVRFLPSLKPGHHPAMLVPYGLPRELEPGVLDIAEHAIAAVQLTLLKPDGSGKADDVEKPKITIGSPAGTPMVLAAMNDLLGLAVCEGVEDALTIHAATGLGAWATGGAGFMPKVANAVPAYTDVVTVYAHADPAGQRGARELANALVAYGIEVRIEGIGP